MDWQQLATWLILAATVTWWFLRWHRARRASIGRKAPCACAGIEGLGVRDTIVYRARKGQRPEIHWRLK